MQDYNAMMHMLQSGAVMPQQGGGVTQPLPNLPYMAPQPQRPMKGRPPGVWNVPKAPGWTQQEIDALSPEDRAIVLDHLGRPKP